MNGNEYESVSLNEDGSVMPDCAAYGGCDNPHCRRVIRDREAQVNRAALHVGCGMPGCDTSGCPGETTRDRAADPLAAECMRLDRDRIRELEAQAERLTVENYRLDRLSRCITIGCGLGGRCDGAGTPGYPCPLARTARTETLETALRELVARVERSGGYATWDDQCVLWRARQALVGGF